MVYCAYSAIHPIILCKLCTNRFMLSNISLYVDSKLNAHLYKKKILIGAIKRKQYLSKIYKSFPKKCFCESLKYVSCISFAASEPKNNRGKRTHVVDVNGMVKIHQLLTTQTDPLNHIFPSICIAVCVVHTYLYLFLKVLPNILWIH